MGLLYQPATTLPKFAPGSLAFTAFFSLVGTNFGKEWATGRLPKRASFEGRPISTHTSFADWRCPKIFETAWTGASSLTFKAGSCLPQIRKILKYGGS